jgi:hypothetical protein
MEEQNLKVELKLSELNLVLQGLGELPAKISFNLIQKVQSQANEQLKNSENGTN